MDKQHYLAHGFHRRRWEQCRSKRSRCDFHEKYRDRAHQLTLLGRFILRAPYSFKNRFPHKVDGVSKQLWVKVGSAWLRCSAEKLKAGYLERQSNHFHQEAYQHGSWRADGTSCILKYGALLFAYPNKSFVNSREPNVYQFRQRFNRGPT